MGREHIYLRGLLHGLNKPEGLVHGLPCAVYAVHSPYYQAELLHLLRGDPVNVLLSIV